MSHAARVRLSRGQRTIGPALTPDEIAAFVAAARGMLRVRWKHQGRTKNGVDCAGLVIYALRAIGREPQDVTGYGRRPYRNALDAAVRVNFGEPLPPETELRAGDVLLMRDGNAAPNHVGIVGDGPHGLTLIHAYAPNKEVVEMTIDAIWREKIIGVYR